ncbi:putative mitochondrion biogenesis protein [Dipodascopsis tothii]|uniref:putative mitochondrion biogenesis protein n=1 Tax=Dipodascopsis tothii TaxID=44089 RepID=UPI0034CD3137
MNGKGLLKDVEVKGLRGVVDRRYVRWAPNADPRDYKHKHQPGDFEIEHFVLEDALVTILQPGGFRPFNVSIFSCDMSQLRKQWLFYDILSANHMSGSYDQSLFTIHPRQTFFDTGRGEAELEVLNEDGEAHARALKAAARPAGGRAPWRKTSRLRVDGVDVEHIKGGMFSGPFSWITSGDVDIVADVMIPEDEDDLRLSAVMHDIVDRWESTMSSRRRERERAAGLLAREAVVNSSEISAAQSTVLGAWDGHRRDRYIVFDVRVQLNNVRAAVPLMAPELSYINNALVRPIVAYINSRKTYISISGRVLKKIDEFDGSWTVYDSGLMDDISAEVYEGFVKNVADDEERARRLKKVGLWSLQLAAQVLLMSIGTLTL